MEGRKTTGRNVASGRPAKFPAAAKGHRQSAAGDDSESKFSAGGNGKIESGDSDFEKTERKNGKSYPEDRRSVKSEPSKSETTRKRIREPKGESLLRGESSADEDRIVIAPVGEVKVIGGNLQVEKHIFEELVEPRPMIVFNHVPTTEEKRLEKISLKEIRSHGSRSVSPMLEVPDAKIQLENIITSRPPL